jgi:hypothetical protein
MNKALLSSARPWVGDRGLSGLAVWRVRAAVLAAGALVIVAMGEMSIAKAGPAPAGRAYEMVSPPDKNGVDVGDSGRSYDLESGMRAAADGNSIIYQARASFGGGASGTQFVSYRATRGANGWTTEPLLPSLRSGNPGIQFTLAASTDLSRLVVSSVGALTTEGFLTAPNNLLMLDATGASTLMTVGQQPSGLSAPFFGGGSSDLSRAVFIATTALTPDAPAGVDPGPAAARGNLYGWTSAGLRLLDVLPDGTIPSQGAATGADSVRGFLDHAISTDASRVFFTVPDDGSGSCLSADCARIYLRDDAFGPAARTVEVTAAGGGPDTPGSYPAVFRGASADGTRAFFTSPAQLTADATTGASHAGNDLYEYRLDGGLTDLTIDHGDTDGANVLGVMGMSDDGASIYFVARGQLDGVRGVAGQPNLYLHRDGEPTRFIATLAEDDDGDWNRGSASVFLGSQVTPDGDHAVFVAREAGLHPQGSRQPTVYEYSVDTGLACVSCDPRGTAPTNRSYVPGLANVILGLPMGTYAPRSITDDGRVFFDSPDALVPEDTNGHYDVYMYDGAPHLISSGRDPDDSEFVDTTANGDNVFFITREQLSGDDVDTNMDLYDARVGGRTVPPRVVAPPCQNDDCRGASPSPGTAPTAATIAFSGAGNVAPPTVTTPKKSAKVTVTKRDGQGAAVALSVKVPAAGRLTARGTDLKVTKRSVGKAGTYRLKVALTAAGRRELRKHRRLAVRVRLTFAPRAGRPATTTVKLTVKA